jgi:hypothetical protein
MSNDLVALAMERAVQRFGGSRGTFNAACFSSEMMKLAGLNGCIDGHLVRAILAGRDDVMPSGMFDGHYTLLRLEVEVDGELEGQRS